MAYLTDPEACSSELAAPGIGFLQYVLAFVQSWQFCEFLLFLPLTYVMTKAIQLRNADCSCRISVWARMADSDDPLL